MPVNACNIADTRNGGRGLQAAVVAMNPPPGVSQFTLGGIFFTDMVRRFARISHVLCRRTVTNRRLTAVRRISWSLSLSG